MADLEIGVCKATIESHGLSVLGDKDAVSLNCRTEYGAPVRVVIFLTERAMGIARASLKICGFDVDAHDIGMLEDDQVMLENNEIPIIVEEYNGKMRAQIQLNRSVEKSKYGSITAKLRAVKKKVAPSESDLDAMEQPPVDDDALPF